MDLIKTMMANRRERGMMPEPPRGMEKRATATHTLPTGPGMMKKPSPCEELEMIKKDIIQKKPRNKVVREYFQKLIEYRNGRCEMKEQAVGEDD